MADFYSSMRDKVAAPLITRFNQGVIELVQLVPGNGPPHNPGPSVRTTTALKATASVAYSVRGGSKVYQDGTTIQVGDVKVTAKVVVGLDPKLSDKIILDGREYNIIQFNRIPESGITVVWVFFVRRG